MSGELRSIARKAWKRFWRGIKEAEIVLEVLDPRDPQAFRIPSVEKRLVDMGKKVILVINKSDLVPRSVLEKWRKFLSREYPTIYVSARNRLGTGNLRRLILKLAPKNADIIKVAVIGYPNVGKSSIINVLKGSHSAPTGAKPGVTRHVQILRRGRLKILDTPGVFPIEDETSLVYKGALRIDKLSDPIKHCVELIEYLLKIDKNVLVRTYNIDEKDPLSILRELAIIRNKLKKGGEPDIEAAARIILKDWQDGKIVIWREPYYAIGNDKA